MKLSRLCAAVAMFALTASAFASPQITVVKEPTKEPAVAKDNQPASALDFKVQNIEGKDADLSQYKGKVVMIVNVASKCGYTPQYKALEALYKKYADQGFVILGFPANDFLKQEPGSNAEIQKFCTAKYGVTFPMMAKISTLAPEKAPIYKFLTEAPTAGDFAGDIAWNFNKFLVDRNGNVIARYGSPVKPDDKQVTDELEKALKAKAAAAQKK
ncbi:MAG TPA: glutathione peroxidase [Tepidisphaeraceae bacterium]|jgi:glutathione peroxidase|nr:glutathione peroxidase [Tepidisphaeraceae bacterium]